MLYKTLLDCASLIVHKIAASLNIGNISLFFCVSQKNTLKTQLEFKCQRQITHATKKDHMMALSCFLSLQISHIKADRLKYKLLGCTRKLCSEKWLKVVA